MTARPSLKDRLAGHFRQFCLKTRLAYLRKAVPLLVPKEAPPPSDRVAVFFINDNNLTKHVSALCMARNLIAEGWDCRFVFESYYYSWPEGASGDELSNVLAVANRHYCRLKRSPAAAGIWTEDFAARRLEYHGLNLFELVDATIANRLRQYSVDLGEPAHAEELARLKASIEAVISVGERVRSLAESGKQVAVILCDALTVPNGAVNFLFHEKSHPLIRTYCLTEANSGYYDGKFAIPEAMLGLMRRSNVFEAYHAYPEDFLPWYQTMTEEMHAQAAQRVEAIIERLSPPDAQTLPPDILQKVEAARAAGKPVYCLFGHLSYDRPLFDNGPIFSDMADWVRQTVEAFRGMDALLLCKPHFVEAVIANQNKAAKTTLADIVAAADPPDNVIVLPATRFGLRSLADKIDAGIVWRSTAYLELGLIGKPAIFCGSMSFYYDILKPEGPSSFEDYQARLARLPSQVPDPEFRRLGAALIYYLNTACVVPTALLVTAPRLFGDNVVISPRRLLSVLKGKARYCTEMSDAIIQRRPMAMRRG